MCEITDDEATTKARGTGGVHGTHGMMIPVMTRLGVVTTTGTVVGGSLQTPVGAVDRGE